jgi:AraC-like DNA-binding protein
MNITTASSILGVFALAFLLLLLVKVALQPSGNKVAKRLLLLMLFGMFSLAFCLFFIYADLGRYWPRLGSIEIGFTYWIGPSLYFYLKRVNGGPDPFARRVNLLHWMPAILVEILFLPMYLRPIPGNSDFLGFSLAHWLDALWAVWLGFHLQLAGYLLVCQPLMQAYRRRLEENFSYISQLNLRWLQICCYGFIAMILAERMLPAVGLTATSFSQTAGITLYLVIIILMYFALGQNQLQFASTEQPDDSSLKYHRSRLRDDSAQYYLDKLARLMAQEHYFLESELSLRVLAERLKLHPHHLSQILNMKLGKSFHDYINELRVVHARQLLLQEPQKSITDIAFESGYNNKNSFYNAFKRHCGMTPSDYRKQRESTSGSSFLPPSAH